MSNPDERWRCDSCDRGVLVVARLHCAGCLAYHDVCLDCAERLRADGPAPLDLRAASADLLGPSGPDRLGIFAVGAREVHLGRCVRTVLT